MISCLRVLICFILFHSTLGFVKDPAMSVASLHHLIEPENLFIKELEGYTQALHLKINSMESLLNDVRSESSTEDFVANPLNSYSIIRRLHEDWSYIELAMSDPVGEVHVNNIRRLIREEAPQEEDLNDAIKAIIRLQSYYRLSAANLTKGLIDGQQYDSKLGVLDTLAVAAFCEERQMNNFALDWFKETIEQLDDIKDDELYEFVYVLNHSHLYAYYSNLLSATERSFEAYKVLNKVADSDVELWLRRRIVQELAVIFDTNQLIEKPLEPTQIGCANQFPASTRLTCHLLRQHSQHFTTLAPFKVEALSLSPYVMLFHDIIYEKEIEELKSVELSSLRHERSKQHNNSMKYTMLTKDPLDVLNLRIEDMTVRRIGQDKDFMLINYGVGGHISTHLDTTPLAQQLKRGQRLATIMFFLSDVPQGGATVFPTLKLSVMPKKGAALLWHNTNQLGKVDNKTAHLSCPVIVGSKWTLVKWLHRGSAT